jgi:hypothetical protein
VPLTASGWVIVGRVADSFQALKDAKAFAQAERDRA